MPTKLRTITTTATAGNVCNALENNWPRKYSADDIGLDKSTAILLRSLSVARSWHAVTNEFDSSE